MLWDWRDERGEQQRLQQALQTTEEVEKRAGELSQSVGNYLATDDPFRSFVDHIYARRRSGRR